MKTTTFTKSAIAALTLAVAPIAMASAAEAQSRSVQPTEQLTVSQDSGTLVRLPAPMADVFIANPEIADIQVRSPRELYVFGKAAGRTTIYATGSGGNVVYAANVSVGRNVTSVDEMLDLAMPEADIQATPMNGLILLTGTVSSPNDAQEAERLVAAYTGSEVVSRLRQATPLQVMLKVRIAEINRTMLKNIGVNLLATDTTDGFQFGLGRGSPSLGASSDLGAAITGGGSLFGLDILGQLDLAENDGLVSTLAEPNLSALSGETASFLAGGEFPIPVSQDLGSISIEYKQFGVGLAFTPFVLADGRISMRVRPEVSELSSAGSIRLNGFEVPALTTRWAETTVELGSGQSFMIAGLLQHSNNNSIEKAPFLGDLPIIGSLFRSTSYQKRETELVIVVTPYLVRPVSEQLALPTDGYRVPTDTQRVLEGQLYAPSMPPRPSAQPAPQAQPGLAAPVASAPVAAAPAQPGFGI